MKKNYVMFALLLSVMLISGCGSTMQHSVVKTASEPKAARPEVMDKELPEPLFFQNSLQGIFDGLWQKPTK